MQSRVSVVALPSLICRGPVGPSACPHRLYEGKKGEGKAWWGVCVGVCVWGGVYVCVWGVCVCVCTRERRGE